MTAAPSLRARIAVALAVGAAGGAITGVKIAQVGHASDFAVFWLAARAFLQGDNPYSAVYAGVRPWITSGFLYPMPAALVLAPFAIVSEHIGAILFSATGLGLLAFVMTREGWSRLPVLMSLPVLLSLTAVQWAPIVTAAAFTPAMAWAAACKPNLGLAIFLARPSRRFVAIAGAVTAASLVARPSWPGEWLTSLGTAVPGSKVMPLLVPGGALLLLAALRWRRWEARLLLGLACVPQTVLFCDQLALAPLATTRMQAIAMGLWSYAVPIGTYVVMRDRMPSAEADSFVLLARMMVWGYYLPSLALVLRRPNEGPAPAWLERWATQWPPWLRGRPA